MKASTTTVTQTIYDFYIGQYQVTLTAEDFDRMELEALTDYIVTSFQDISQNAKISDSKVKLQPGETKALAVTGTLQEVVWSSADKKVAAVSDDGKLTAVAPGETTITAMAGSVKITCTVTVIDPTNTALTSQEVSVSPFKFNIPFDWSYSSQTEEDDDVVIQITPDDSGSISSIKVTIGEDTPQDYATLKESLNAYLNESMLYTLLKKELGTSSFHITNMLQTDLTTSYGQVYKYKYTVSANSISITQYFYFFYMDQYLISIMAMEIEPLDLDALLDSMVSSFQTN